MMADLRELNCSRIKMVPSKSMKSKMLESAKLNLAKLSMFGLNEYLYATQYLFTWTLGLEFKQIMKSRNSTHFSIDNISNEDIKEIEAVTWYDAELYKFAEKLFFHRLRYAATYDKKHGIEVPKEVYNSLMRYYSS